MKRRNFLLKSGLSAGIFLTPDLPVMLEGSKKAEFKLSGMGQIPVIIKSIEILKIRNDFLIEVRSEDGHSGRIPANEKISHLLGILMDLIIPFFIGKNARDMELLLPEIYRVNSNYKYAGMPFWISVAHVELAVLDMLAGIENRSVARMLGKPVRKEFPVYMSTFDRENTAEVYTENVLGSIGDMQAVKLKIGGRMSNNRDCIEGRTEKLIPMMRKALGTGFTIYVDANSSYDAPKAIETGRLLEEYRYGFFEEPCPWQDYQETLRVAEALDIPVAGGEQDSSEAQFRYMMDKKVVDVVQPDIMYNGGFLRNLKIAAYAKQKGVPITLHSPQQGAANVFKMQFASIVENIGPYQEYTPGKGYEWCSVDLIFKKGNLQIVDKPGWGIDYDEDALKRAVRF
ncbi:MAG: mandelate racemase/muconate lactonizing enzyme family protein [Cyclobacteriaceae bacterium]|nr:mandelate racemase/muconate lactonizing enzyme family protein [Cyclobacteriaceae bacterium]